MTSNFNEMEQLRYFSTAARLANKERISAVEERWVRGYLDRYAPPQVAEPGFPEAPSGDARDRNNLRRTNWFNGRYLTAEALSRQDVYFDHRARLNAQALMPGIAWGLGIEGEGLNRLSGNARRGGLAAATPLTLRRGLAFDGVGRPILVSQDFRFSLADLIGVSLKNPRRVVGGQREFTPCVCLAPEPGGPSGGSAALPSGPYLLVIEAGEVPEGKARVTGDVCGGRRSAPCEADLWQGSFGLSLVRFPVDAPLLKAIPDVWALRGTLSAYYFDVFEHPLWRRWDPAFPVDGSFSRGTGSGRHEGQAIPLALVHLGEDGTALYLDSWIPRRVISATPGEDWHRTRFGAPPRAAVWARIHQFQTMLQESLVVRPMARTAPAEANLHGRGFRHIPPIGFLPVVPRPMKGDGNQGRRILTACTRFSAMQETETAPNPFQGDQATFSVQGPNIRLNQIRNRVVKGLILNQSESCTIVLAQPAEQVNLRLRVNLADNFIGTTGTGVIAYGIPDASGQTQMLATQEILQANQLVTVALRASGIQRVIVSGKYETVLTEFCYDYLVVDPPLPAGSSRAALIREALREAEAYFVGTNVVPYGVVALHDDDILEDLHNVIDKDPLQLEQLLVQGDGDPLRNWPRPNATSSERISALVISGLLLSARGSTGVVQFLLLLRGVLNSQGLDIDALVNRRTEVVKLVVPLQGLSRRHPLLGAITEDAVRQAPAWGLAGPEDLDTSTLAGLLRVRGVDMLPRSCVVYVKQRLVLQDLVLGLVEGLQKLVEFILAANGGNTERNGFLAANLSQYAEGPQKRIGAMTAATTNDYRIALRAQSESDQLLIRSTLAQPVVKELLLQTIEGATPALARGNRAARFRAQVQEVANAQPAGAGNTVEGQRLALAQVADAWAAEYPDVQVIQLLAAVQPPEQTLELVRELGVRPGPSAGPTVADGLDLVPPKQFETETSRTLYADVRSRLEERPLADLVADLPTDGVAASLTVGELLARSPQEAEQLMGGAPKLEEVRTAFLRNREDALNAAEGLADGVPRELVARVEAEVGRGVAADEALAKLKEEEAAKPQPDALLLERIDRSATLLRLGGNRLDVLGGLRRPPGA